MIEYNRCRPSDQINDPSTETPTTTPGAPTSVWVTAEMELMKAPPQRTPIKRKTKINHAHAYLAAYLYPLHKFPANFSGIAVTINSPGLRFFAVGGNRIILIV